MLAPNFVTALIGIVLISAGANGYLIKPIGWLKRLLLIPAGIALIVPLELAALDIAINIAGAILGIFVLAPEWYRLARRRLHRSSAGAEGDNL